MKKQHEELIQQSVIIIFHFFVYMLFQLLTDVSFFNSNSFTSIQNLKIRIIKLLFYKAIVQYKLPDSFNLV